jgi:hypothetical protein
VAKALSAIVVVVMYCAPVGSINVAASVYEGQFPFGMISSANVQVREGSR